MLRVASTDGLVNQMADGVLRVASTDELLYQMADGLLRVASTDGLVNQMADGLLRVASTDVAKSKNPASPREYFFAGKNNQTTKTLIHLYFM